MLQGLYLKVSTMIYNFASQGLQGWWKYMIGYYIIDN